MATNQQPVEIRQIKPTEFGEVNGSEFAISYPLHTLKLRQSIDDVGLIQPLLVVLRDGAYQVVCGHRRLSACLELGHTVITCLLLPDLSSLELLNLAIEDNLSTRQLNIVEQANIIRKLLNQLTADEVICKYLPKLGLQPHYKILDKFLDIARLKEGVKKAIVSGHVHEEAAIRLSKWPAKDQIPLVDIFTEIHFSTSVQQEIISNIWEISQREDIKISEILAASDVADLLNDDALSNPQKGDRLRRYLIKRRYPELTLAEARYKEYSGKLNLPGGTRLIPPAHFEASGFKLECSIANQEQLNKQIFKLSETMKNPAWEGIFKLGTGI